MASYIIKKACVSSTFSKSETHAFSVNVRGLGSMSGLAKMRYVSKITQLFVIKNGYDL